MMIRASVCAVTLIALMSGLTQAQPRRLAQPGWTELLNLNYRLEVTGYCSLATRQVATGYLQQLNALLDEFDFPESLQLEARGKGWQAANEEWMNRGLGGFKRWCRGEAQQYADGFIEAAQLKSQ